MPNKKGKNNKNKTNNVVEKRTLLYKEDMQEYAKVVKALGDRRLNVMLVDKTEVMAIIPGKFRKRCWMKAGDIIIVSRRQFQETKWDVCYKYNEDEVRILLKKQELPLFFLDLLVDSSTNNDENDETNELFGYDSDDSDNNIAPQPNQNRSTYIDSSDDESSDEIIVDNI
jgi:translation initiation factor 1A